MSDDLDGGGRVRIRKARVRTSDRRYVKGIVMVFVGIWIIMILSCGYWDLNVRPKTMDEIAEWIIDEPTVPGFDSNLAGSTMTVQGEVTSVYTIDTTQGALTFIGVDSHPVLSLIQWGASNVKVGDTITRDVHFERTRVNDYALVSSPQLSWPVLGYYKYWVLYPTSDCLTKICLWGRDDPNTDKVIVEVTLPTGTAFPLELFNVSLRKEVGLGWMDFNSVEDYLSSNPRIDYMSSLNDGISENGLIEYYDDNMDGMLDDGDHFEVLLARPSSNLDYMSHLLDVNFDVGQTPSPYHGPFSSVLSGSYYAVTTSKGVLDLSTNIRSRSLRYPEVFTSIVSEYEDVAGITTEILVSDVWGSPSPLEDFTFIMRESTWPDHRIVRCWVLVDNGFWSQDNLSVSFSDADSDGLLTVGDRFLVSGLKNQTGHKFHVDFSPFSWTHALNWITGVGSQTGLLPVVEWDEPIPLDPPTNRSFRLGIMQMYGVSGVPLEGSESGDWFEIEVRRNDSLVLSLEIAFEFTFSSSDFDVSFHDADSNGYVNLGDFFLMSFSGPGDTDVILSYYDSISLLHPDPVISWNVFFQTG